VFDALAKRLSQVFKSLSGSVINQAHIDQTLREIRVSFLEADVSLSVVKEISEDVKAAALGQEVVKSIRPAQMMIKIVHDVLVKNLTNHESELILKKPLTTLLMVGLQGTGKTTFCGKLGYYFQKRGHRVLLVSLDIYRPAAQKQLEILAQQAKVQSLSIVGGQSVEEIAKRGLHEALSSDCDVVIFDTAGRTTLDEPLMRELQTLQDLISPTETLLVADALLGQTTLEMGKAFGDILAITGIALSRMDADAKGGVALSLSKVLQKPLKLMGTGEKIADIERFDPLQVAGRILDQGDIVALVEKAAETIDIAEQEKAMKRMQKGIFSLDDLASMFLQMEKMGGMKGFLKFLPGMRSLSDDVMQKAEKASFKKEMAIISSMTLRERRDPQLLNGSRKKRIAQGSGCQIQDINRLLSQFDQIKKVMKQLGGMKKYF
jgi:signal recognition particle subunit SRP54